MKLYLGQKVIYLCGGEWKPTGEVIEIERGIKMNGAQLTSDKCRVRWDDGEESGWLSHYDVNEVKETL